MASELQILRDLLAEVRLDKSRVANTCTELESELNRLRQRDREIEAAEAYLAAKVEKIQGKASSDPGNGAETQGAVPIDASNMKKHEMCQRILVDAGEPMKTKAIVAAMVARGWGSESDAVLTNAVYTAMKRHREIFTLPKAGTWGLAEWER